MDPRTLDVLLAAADTLERIDTLLASRVYTARMGDADDQGCPAYVCTTCRSDGTWSITREGDAVVAWACDRHLSNVIEGLHRPGQIRQRFIVVRSLHRLAAEVREAMVP